MQAATRPGAGRHIVAGITWAEARRVLSLLTSALRSIHTGIFVRGVPLDKQVSVSHPAPDSLDATGSHRARLLRPHGVNSRSIRSRSDWQGQRSVRYPTIGLRAVGPRATYGPDAAMISGQARSAAPTSRPIATPPPEPSKHVRTSLPDPLPGRNLSLSGYLLGDGIATRRSTGWHRRAPRWRPRRHPRA